MAFVEEPELKYNSKIVLAYFAEVGLPTPELEHRFHPDRKWRFDFAWMNVLEPGRLAILEPRLVALEVEGGIWIGASKKGMGSHARPVHFVKDMEKYNEAAASGWRVIRRQPKELCTLETATLIARCLGTSLKPNFVSVGVEEDCAPD